MTAETELGAVTGIYGGRAAQCQCIKGEAGFGPGFIASFTF